MSDDLNSTVPPAGSHYAARRATPAGSRGLETSWAFRPKTLCQTPAAVKLTLKIIDRVHCDMPSALQETIYSWSTYVLDESKNEINCGISAHVPLVRLQVGLQYYTTMHMISWVENSG
jgi:hypothetical protein